MTDITDVERLSGMWADVHRAISDARGCRHQLRLCRLPERDEDRRHIGDLIDSAERALSELLDDLDGLVRAILADAEEAESTINGGCTI